jgi:hypothetical protein
MRPRHGKGCRSSRWRQIADFDGRRVLGRHRVVWCHLPAALRLSASPLRLALADDGVFLLEAYRPAQLSSARGSDAALRTRSASWRATSRLTTHGVETQRDVQEGILLRGPSAVVQVVAHRRRGHTREA